MGTRTLAAGAVLLWTAGAALAQAPAQLPARPAAPAPQRVTPAEAVPALSAAAPAERPALFGAMTAGGIPLTLGESTLADVARAFGGQLDEGGEGAAKAAWLCYAGTAAGKPALFWFVSAAETGGPDQALTTIAIEPQDERGAGACAPAPATLTGIEAGIPGPGARLADLRAALGEATPGPSGHVHYAASFPAAAAGGATRQTAIYTGAGGRVIGLALNQVPGD